MRTPTINPLLCAAMLVVCASGVSNAKDPIRIWVDSTGRYSVEASLKRIEGNTAILVRRDGGTAEMPIDRLSQNDQKYIESFQQEMAENVNVLRELPPEPPALVPMERLQLPSASFEAPKDAELMLGMSSHSIRPGALPKELASDPSPDQIVVPETNIQMDRIDPYDICSSLVQVGDAEKPMLAMSVCAGLSIPGEVSTDSKLLMFDPVKRTSQVVYSSTEAITLMDHNFKSGQSLVVLGHNPLGHGGRIGVVSGWENGRVTVVRERALPEGDDVGEFPHIRWARWIDDEHFLAIMDGALVGWNVVSGETFLRLDGVDANAVPALSGGRRYVALPSEGCVYLYKTTDGSPLGRIGVEANSVPSVSFSRYGNALAIMGSRRLRIWDLPAAALSGDVQSKRNLGQSAPVWVDSDLVLSGTGVLMSIHRGLPVWRYEITGAAAISMGSRVALLKKHPYSSVSVVKMPHGSATQALDWIDNRPIVKDKRDWELPGRSVWNKGDWKDRDVRISLEGVNLR